MPEPKKNTAFTFSIGLIDLANRPFFKLNPTLATGDFKVSIDGAAFNNLATLPTVAPAGGRNVEVSLSAGEMGGDRIVVQAVDVAGSEWDEVMITILPSVAIVDDLSSRIPAALVSGKMDSVLGDAASISAAAGNKVADHVLRRSSAGARASAFGDAPVFRSLLGAASKLHNRVRDNGGQLEIFDETDTGTPFGTQTITTTPGSDPITELNTN